LRDILQSQELRLQAQRLGLLLAGVPPTSGHWPVQTGALMVTRDVVPSGFDPEFELLALPGQTYLGRIFFMSTVADRQTHMFEAKAEVLGWAPEMYVPPTKEVLVAASSAIGDGRVGEKLAIPPLISPAAPKVQVIVPKKSNVRLWPGFTAKIRFPLKSNPNALVIPEEAVRASERGFIAFVPVVQRREDGAEEWIARARVLELGFRADGWVEVRQGLSAGERVVRRGAEALEDGTPIRIKS
jgi:multidrug efflux pump subunit AcrA (membrane-fusion protein)